MNSLRERRKYDTRDEENRGEKQEWGENTKPDGKRETKHRRTEGINKLKTVKEIA